MASALRTVAEVTPRPLADRVDGLDRVVTAVATAAGEGWGIDERLVAVRFALADFVRRHGDLCAALEAGIGAGVHTLIAAELAERDIVDDWPALAPSNTCDDTCDGLATQGDELAPVARTVLARSTTDREGVLDGAQWLRGRVEKALRCERGDVDDLAGTVVIEFLDALLLADIVEHLE